MRTESCLRSGAVPLLTRLLQSSGKKQLVSIYPYPESHASSVLRAPCSVPCTFSQLGPNLYCIRVAAPLTWFTVPPTVASPCSIAFSSTSFHSAPPPTYATRVAGSTLTARRYLLRSMTRPPLVEEAEEVLCPPPGESADFAVDGVTLSRSWRWDVCQSEVICQSPIRDPCGVWVAPSTASVGAESGSPSLAEARLG